MTRIHYLRPDGERVTADAKAPLTYDAGGKFPLDGIEIYIPWHRVLLLEIGVPQG